MLASMFARAGLDKFSDAGGWAPAFAQWGFPVWFRVLVGVVEVAAAALLLLPRTAPYGAMLVVSVMLGAMWTHVRVGRPQHMRSEVVPLVFAATVLVARRRVVAEDRRRLVAT